MRRLRYSLRFVLVATTILALVIAYFADCARNERAALAAINESGGWVTYDHEYDSSQHYVRNADSKAPTVLVDVLGRHWFDRIVTASGLTSEFGDTELATLSRLSKLRSVSNNHAWAGSQIATISMNHSRVYELPKEIGDSEITDVGLSHLANCKSLESIALRGDSMTNTGIEHLSELPNLKYLAISSLRVTDESIDALARMTELETLVATETRISKDGFIRLKSRLPNCKVYDRPPQRRRKP